MARKLLPTALLWIAAGTMAALPAAAVIPDGFSEVVVLGTNSVSIEHDVDVTSGDVVANDASPGPTLVDGFELAVSRISSVAGSLRGDSVFIDRRTTVGGDVAYNDLTNRGTIQGSELTPLSLPVFGVLPLFHTGPSDGPDVSVGQHQTQTLAPGTYGDVTVGQQGTLILSGGVYHLRSLSTAHRATLAFEGPVDVRIAGRLHAGRHVAIGPAAGSGLGAADGVFYVAGADGTTPAPGSVPAAFRIDEQGTVVANLYVPNGTLSFDHHTRATGAFLGKDVFVGHHSTIALDTFFVNKPPVAGDDSATVLEGGSVSVLDSGETSLLANDTDPNGDNLFVTTTPVTPPAHGLVVLNADGTFTYTHDGSETLADAFEYEVCDDGVEPGPLCDVGAVGITVIPVNDPPVADPQAVTTPQNTFIDLTLTGSDAEGDILTFSIVSAPSNGILQSLTQVPPSSATVRYLPNADFTGVDSFDFQVDDGNGGTDTATVTITVEAVNFPPEARSDSAIVEPGGTVTTLVGGAASVLANDTDPDGDSLTVTTTPVSGPSNGTLTLNADGTFSYTHDGGASTSDSFVYEVCDDGTPVACSTATVFITMRQLQVTVSVTKSGPGAADSLVLSSPGGIDCGSVCSAQFSTGQPIFLIAEAAAGFAFDF
ncbi:MAG TPA: cadherin-like domain-containing protein, partial [Thermoanaerobaculia bacterium]|nr:cadherin-like domain-containing protein [Thermoanaerobaculia bacterium]